MPVRVKSERQDESRSGVIPPVTTSAVEQATAGLPSMDLDSDEDELLLEEDEIVREMDVFLSPELSHQIYLMQFPLQQRSSQLQRSKPQAARIKPRHCMIELDYATRSGNDDDHQDFSGQFFMSARTYASQTIPVSTHMALGKLVTDNDSGVPALHLVPLTRITQMRPSFHHVNEATLQMSSISEDDPESTQDGGARRPLNFQKKESERAALARKSSYAFKKASEDSEIWIPLEVHAETSSESEQKLEKVVCSTPDYSLLLGRAGSTADSALSVEPANDGDDPMTISSNQHIAAISTSAVSSSSYVQSLNYLPQSQVDNLKLDSGNTKIGDNSHKPENFVSTVAGKMMDLMHQGRPMPYSVLRPQFDSSLFSDDVLLQALNNCSFWVRGNFILQSRLLPLPAAVGHARTFILFLLQCLGVVHRARLHYAYDGDDQVTPEVIVMLLEQVARKTDEGWKLKVDDDVTFERKYPTYVPLHLEFWKKQVRRFGPLLERYRNTPQGAGGSS